MARLLAAVCALALAAAAVIMLPAPSHHPPDMIAVRPARADMPINPTAFELPDIDAYADGLTTTTTTTAPLPPPPPSTTISRPTPPVQVPATDIDQIIANWFPTQYAKARAVAVCESSLDPTVIGGSNFGLFQINRVHADDFEHVTGIPFAQGWSDPNLNAMYAAHLQVEQGWGPWACA